MGKRRFWTYIVCSTTKVLYVGVTNDIERRVWEHRNSLLGGFTSKYKCQKLVWFEEFVDVREAIDREKEIKGWVRARKVAIVASENPGWEDLAAGWFKGFVTLEDVERNLGAPREIDS